VNRAPLKVKVKLSLYFFLTEHHDMKTYWGSILWPWGTRWRWVVSFTPRPLYRQGKTPWYSLDRTEPYIWKVPDL